MSRVELAKIKALLFYKDAETAARRTAAIPQLICRGTPCKRYQPEVVRCVNLGGGVGTDVDWKCEADLPEKLRFGKVEVSCEGWSKPGDPYVLKDSCSLEYRLVQVPDALRNGNTDSPLFDFKSYDIGSILFSILWIGVLIFILYGLFSSCFRENNAPRTPRGTSGSGPRPGGGSGWFPGSHNDDASGPPPPYSKTTNAQADQGWRPGFWTGAAVGGLANQFWNSRRQADPRTATWDWERERVVPRTGGSWFGTPSRRPTARTTDDNRGEGSSNLGSMRSSTGLGGSSVR